MSERFDALDLAISRTMSRLGVPMARISLGIVFIWFGVLKPFGHSPAEELVRRTVYWGVDPDWFVPVLAEGLIPDEDREKILHGNASRFYGW